MRTMLAIILAFIILINGWLLLSGVLYGIGHLLLLDHEDMVLMHCINHFLMLVLSPGFGGFFGNICHAEIIQ